MSTPKGMNLYAPIIDGSQVLPHTAWDLRQLEEATGAIPGLGEALAVEGTEGALLRDTFFSLHRAFPEGDPLAPLREPYQINQRAIEQMMSTAEWKQLRATTVGDGVLAAVGASGIAKELNDAIPEEAKQQAEELDRLERDIDKLLNQEESFRQMAEDFPEDQDTFNELAEQAAQEAADKQAGAQPIAESLAAQADSLTDSLRQASRQAISGVQKTVENLDSAMEGFAAGYGTDEGQPGGKRPTAKEKIQLAARLNQRPNMRQLADLAGRMRRLAMATQRVKVNHAPEEVDQIEQGNDLTKLLPSELALLAAPRLRPLFAIKYAEHALMQYRLKGREKQGRGPIIVAVDESGSMSGDKDTWAKAVTLGLLAIANKQKREFVVMQFSSECDLRVLRFEKGQATYNDTLDIAEHFFSGGTAYEPWMNKAMDLITKASEQDALKRADVIIISDGDVSIYSGALKRWNDTRKAHEVRCYSVLIGTRDGLNVLKQVSDDVITLDNLKADRKATDLVFAIGG